MYVLNETYAIKSDENQYSICVKRKPDPKKTRKKEYGYQPRWHFNTLKDAILFLIDRAIDIPEDLNRLNSEINTLKEYVKKCT